MYTLMAYVLYIRVYVYVNLAVKHVNIGNHPYPGADLRILRGWGFWAGILQGGGMVQVRGNFHILTSAPPPKKNPGGGGGG